MAWPCNKRCQGLICDGTIKKAVLVRFYGVLVSVFSILAVFIFSKKETFKNSYMSQLKLFCQQPTITHGGKFGYYGSF
jgi:hypothetical protein